MWLSGDYRGFGPPRLRTISNVSRTYCNASRPSTLLCSLHSSHAYVHRWGPRATSGGVQHQAACKSVSSAHSRQAARGPPLPPACFCVCSHDHTPSSTSHPLAPHPPS